MKERVKFYSKNDYSIGFNLIMAEEIIKKYHNDVKYKNVNDIIEFHNIQKFFSQDLKLNSWTEEQALTYNKIVKKDFEEIISRYFNTINSENFIMIYKMVDIEYRDDFLEIIENKKIYKSISHETFSCFIKLKNVYIGSILKFKYLVSFFGEPIKKRLLEHPKSGELILDKYVIKNENNIYLPRELSTEDKEAIIIKYINSKDANLNYIRLILKINNTKEFSLSDITKFKAQKKAEKLEAKFFPSNSGYYSGINISFIENQVEARKICSKREKDGLTLIAKYSVKWLEQNPDYATLLNNFIYLFDYVDDNFRFTNTSKREDLGIFERNFMYSKNDYIKGIAFDMSNKLAILQMWSYYKQLLKLKIRFEEIISWFFKDYLKSEFKIKNFQIKIPTEESSYLEKCRMIAPEMEKSLKQYRLWVRDKKITQELLNFTSPIQFSDIPSANLCKYVYLNNNSVKCKQIMYLLFSDQTLLGYFGKIGKGKEYKNLDHALLSRNVNINEYEKYQMNSIQYLCDNDILNISEIGDLSYIDKDIIRILKDLYFNEVISYYYYPNETRCKFDILFKKDYIIYGDTLFSKPEIDYLNFYLNKSTFTNGLDLRNSYLHGTESEQHEEDYMIFLMLYVLMIIKINDDLCLYDEYLNKDKK